MSFQFGTFRANSRIDIPDTVSFGRNQFYRLLQKNLAVDILVLSGSIRKMITDIAHIGGPQQGIANRMQQYVSIRMSQQPFGMFQTDTAQPQFTTFDQLMYVEAKTYSYFHKLFNK